MIIGKFFKCCCEITVQIDVLYIVRFYILKVLYLRVFALFGKNHGGHFGVDSVSTLLWIALIMSMLQLSFKRRIK